ncbi:MAG TPA: DivIVA domain-containing protein [Naasia sp.]|jgi:DivIVA domain-containing protein
MSSTFPRSRRSKLGYRVRDVDEFLREARRAYDAPVGAAAGVDAAVIRRTAFPMEKGGYSTVHVDAALERLEDAFSLREREHAIRTLGDRAWYGETRSAAAEITARLNRPAGRRFERAGFLSQGYSPDDVDAFADRLRTYFEKGTPIGVDEVRAVAFRPKLGGYREWQVDLVLDAVVDVMLAVR